ncbi:MAG: DNA polymerase III subunit delta [Paludibacteraceae bacterium]|nr:DNA polymerase III subunit delta [Paludibacteraceae bacterium]
MQTYEQILKNLKSGQWAPVYFLSGEETYYTDLVSNYIENNVLDEMAREFDQMVVYGKDLAGGDISPVISAARSFPMMGERKVIVVKEAQTITKWEPLAMYLDNPQPTTLLCFCYKYKKVDQRLALFKNLEKKGGVLMQYDKLRDYQMVKWINDYIANQNIAVDPRVPQLLADYIGNDLSLIATSLSKLLDGRPEGQTKIDLALVERNIGISKDFNNFELQSALIKGDVVKANRITQYFAANPKSHDMIKELAILFSFFANLMLFHYLPDKQNDQAVASALHINPYAVRDYREAAKRFSAGKTFRIIGYCRETDARLKGINNVSAKDADLWKELIYKILH